jgi:adenylate cyclase
MLNHEFHYRWEWQLQSNPETLWPFIADTDRFSRDIGYPSLENRLAPGERLANARRRLLIYRFGVPVEWEEEPFEWVRPSRYGVMRRYRRGPISQMRTLAELTPRPEGGTRLVYQVWARPANILGLIAIPAQIGVLSAHSFDATMRRYDRRVAARQYVFDVPQETHFASGGRARLAKLREALLTRGAAPELLDRLVDLVEHTDDLSLARLRPYALADEWGARRRAVLELCLLATRAGLLELSWDVLCPLCRGAKQRSETLGEIQSQTHCETCNIDFTANFERSVELTFRPNPAVRPLENQAFCIGGPQLTPHIIAQQFLPPNAQRAVNVSLEAGRYRLRTLELRGGEFLLAAPDGAAEAAFRATPAGWPDDEPRLGLTSVLRLENATPQEQLFILERMAWSDQAATAAEVTTLQLFRDLFANEALRPGERISVGSLTVMFTDLRDSTRMYREVGDAVAFGRVMNHFDVLREAINSEQGAVVKTIGDSVMAVFIHPIAALRAILKVQHELAHPPAGISPLQLKGGIHYGPAIAVTLNERLDYFGSTINLAARLEALSSTGGIVISAAVRNDPEVAEYLAQLSDLIQVASFAAKLKGFEDEDFELWRVSLAEQIDLSRIVS